MLEFIAKIILVGSILGMGFMIFRKIPVLSKIPEIETKLSEKKAILTLSVLREKTKLFKSVLSQKIHKLKNLKKEKNFKEEETNLSDNYWEKIRKG
ncbi:hypothetical protein KJA17_01100 [Patescibacteria group bacterium]|nr:hypothetical protein [Patescibacteria group bacterium]